MPELSELVQTLCEASREDFTGPAGIQWPDTLDPGDWFFAPELVSIQGTPAWEALGEDQRRRVAFYEAVNFFSLNIHGERSLVEGLAHRLYRKESAVTTPYLHYFLEEENRHMVYFGEFCTRYAGKVYPEKKLALPREHAPGEEDFLFFARVLVFEEIVDVFNVAMARDLRLHPVARRINDLHHRDESRHLAFGRRIVRELFAEHHPSWSPEVLAGVREDLAAFVSATWREYYNPQAYQDAGLPEPYALRQAAFEHPASRERRRRVDGPCLRFLQKHGILLEEPAA